LESLKNDFKSMRDYKDKVKAYNLDSEALRTISGGTTVFGGS